MRRYWRSSSRSGSRGSSSAVDAEPLIAASGAPELVAHQLQELRPRTLQRVERRQVLQGHHHPLHRAAFAADGSHVDQRAHTVRPRRRDLDLFRANRLRVHEIAQHDLAPVAAPADHRLAQPLQRGLLRSQPGQDAPRLPVERKRRGGRGVQHRHPDRAGLDQRLQIGPGPLLVAVGARVGERRRRLLSEQHQRCLVGVGESALLAAEEESAHGHVAVTHRGRLECPAGHREGGEAGRADPGVEIGEPQRRGEPAQMPEQPEPVRPRFHRPVFFVREARGDEVAGLPRLVHRGDDAIGRAGERAGALNHLVQHRVEVEARADPQDRRGQRGLA